MQPHAMKFIYSAVNAVASRKFDRETEERMSQTIEAELLAIATDLLAQSPMEIAASTYLGRRD